jgi:hypothetical protein
MNNEHERGHGKDTDTETDTVMDKDTDRTKDMGMDASLGTDQHITDFFQRTTEVMPRCISCTCFELLEDKFNF